MKKLSLLFLIGIAFSAFTFTSCDKIADEVADAVEVTINTELEAPLVVTEMETKADDYAFEESAILDPSKNTDLADYLSQITNVEVTSLNLLVTSISDPNLILTSGAFSITHGDLTFTYNTPANQAIAVGTTFTVSNTHPDWATLQKIVGAMETSTVSAVGKINNSKFTIGYLYKVGVKVTAKPLSTSDS